jgi:hypothetical protein
MQSRFRTVIPTNDPSLTFAPGFKFDDISPDYNTEAVSLGDSPPSGPDTVPGLIDRTLGRLLRFAGAYLLSALVYSTFYFILFAFSWAACINLERFILVYFDFSVEFERVARLIILFVAIFLVVLLLNAARIPQTIHNRYTYGRLTLGSSWRPVWMSQDYPISAADVHFGRLKVLYSFDKRALFVIQPDRKVAMSIDFSVIKDVQIESEKRLKREWEGQYGTPPVTIVLKRTGYTSHMRIHGAYFEDNGDGKERAKEFVKQLSSRIKSG